MTTDERTFSPETWNELNTVKLAPPRVMRGLRFPVLPSGSLLAQVAGGAAFLAGTYLQFGAGVSLIVGGAAAAVLGALREAKKI